MSESKRKAFMQALWNEVDTKVGEAFSRYKTLSLCLPELSEEDLRRVEKAFCNGYLSATVDMMKAVEKRVDFS